MAALRAGNGETPVATDVAAAVQGDGIGTIIFMTVGGAVMLGTILQRRDRAGWSAAPGMHVSPRRPQPQQPIGRSP